MIASHKEKSGRDVPVVSEISYIYAAVADYLAILKNAMNDIARQNYLPYARNIRLDLKGKNYGTRGERIIGTAARTTMRCYISIPAPSPVVIPAGTRFVMNEYLFHTESNYSIAAGETYVDVPVVCDTIGDIGTIPPGDLKDIVDRYDYYDHAENITPLAGGQNAESDDEYRARLELLPESFTSAGAEGAYMYWILSNPDAIVTDIQIVTPSENHLDIYVLNKQETITTEQKNAILARIYNEPEKKIRAMGDVIQILDPTITEYQIDLDFYLYDNALENAIKVETDLTNVLQVFVDSFKMGDSLLFQDVVKLCKENPNVRYIDPPFQDIAAERTTLLKCTGITLHPAEA